MFLKKKIYFKTAIILLINLDFLGALYITLRKVIYIWVNLYLLLGCLGKSFFFNYFVISSFVNEHERLNLKKFSRKHNFQTSLFKSFAKINKDIHTFYLRFEYNSSMQVF